MITLVTTLVNHILMTDILGSLPTEKATGLDGINAKFLKAGAAAIAPSLAHYV